MLYISFPDITDSNTEMAVSRGDCIAPLLRIVGFPGSNFGTNPSIYDRVIGVYS